MQATDDIRVQGYTAMKTPHQLKEELPISKTAQDSVQSGRKAIQNILDKKDRRLLVISGPCSIHDEEAALDYAQRLARLSRQVDQTMLVVMRVYFEKPRTTVGWKGLINDPHLDDSCDVETGLYRARKLLMQINEMGLPVATEMLDPITPQYVADLVSWSAIGARTTESQTHRQMASGLSMPVGFKNSTDGNLGTAVNAMQAARANQTFLGIDQDGRTCVVKTQGNAYGHVVLRGGEKPNYDPISIEETRLNLIKKGLPEAVVVDCSHANCHKKHQGQGNVFKNVLEQILQGNEAILGVMLESNIHEGKQKFTGDFSALKYGVSITDECISWETTEELLNWGHKRLSRVKQQAA
ncbi:MAG: 3-deoxy-7-phosphoheptulonate synthase [Desulfovermiculus sp.]